MRTYRFAIAGLFLLTGLGWWAGTAPLPTVVTNEALPIGSASTPPSSLGFALAEVVKRTPASGPGDQEGPLPLTVLEQRLASAFLPDPPGVLLRRMVLAPRSGEGDETQRAVVERGLAEFHQDPTAAARAIRRALETLSGEEFPQERLRLVQWLARLPGLENAAAEAALSEAARGGEEVGQFERIAIAHATFLQVADERFALSGTRQLLVAQKDAELRARFRGQFLAKYPDLGVELNP